MSNHPLTRGQFWLCILAMLGLVVLILAFGPAVFNSIGASAA